MKRSILLILSILILALSVAGCSNSEENTADTTAVTAATTVTAATVLPETTAEKTSQAVETATQNVSYGGDITAAPLYSHESVTNILLIGVDGNSDWGRSDTLMLLTLDNLHGKIKMTSFLRDTFVSIPGYDPDKLNAAYAYGGVSLCVETMEYNFGIAIDGYAIVNFKTFKNLINAMGGVDVYLTEDEIDYINAQVAQNSQQNPIPDGTGEGVVHLTGGQALWHVRNRGGEVNGIYFYGTDWDRVDRQQRMFEGMIKGLTSLSLSEVSDIAYTVLPYVSTDLSSAELAGHISKALTYLGYSIERASIPTDYWENSYYDYAGAVLEITDWDALRRDVATFIYENIE